MFPERGTDVGAKDAKKTFQTQVRGELCPSCDKFDPLYCQRDNNGRKKKKTRKPSKVTQLWEGQVGRKGGRLGQIES